MRLNAYTVASLFVVAAGLTVSGCATKSSTDSSGSAPGLATTAVANAGLAATTPADGSTTTTSSAASSDGTSSSGGTCQPDNLRFGLGAKSGSNQVTQVVDMTNTGSAACTMDGFPGVDLDGLTNGQQNYTWSLVRSNAHYSRVTLQPGGTAHFDLVYLPDSTGGSADIAVTKFVVTPPNAFTQAEVTWNQSVLLQDSATRPGTYVTPVAAGS